MRLLALILLSGIAFASAHVHADLYGYIDEQGAAHLHDHSGTAHYAGCPDLIIQMIFLNHND